jgi:hypothetical protein
MPFEDNTILLNSTPNGSDFYKMKETLGYV